MLHSPTMPRWRTTLIAVVRSMWYSSSVRVCEGATTIESPVCTPSGSKFSMLQTVMQLSAASRTTSYSTSFQPLRDFSTSSWGRGGWAGREGGQEGRMGRKGGWAGKEGGVEKGVLSRLCTWVQQRAGQEGWMWDECVDSMSVG